jgi:hypothetical protein
VQVVGCTTLRPGVYRERKCSLQLSFAAGFRESVMKMESLWQEMEIRQ